MEFLERNKWPILAGSILAGGVLGGLGLVLYGSRVEAKKFRLEKLNVTTGGARGANYGAVRKFKILHISDLHLCANQDEKAAFLERISDDEFDFVILTGDVFENETGFEYASSLLRRKPRIGAFAVLGNHDYFHYSLSNRLVGKVNKRWYQHPETRNVKPWIKALSDVGFTVLRNEAHTIHDHDVHMIGIDWPTIKEQHFHELVSRAEPHHFLFTIFHLPVNLRFMAQAGVHLALGGHTHGGQVRVPGMGAIITDSELPRHEASGIVKRGDTVFHISRGLGADPRTDFRIFCPPAATVLHVDHVS